MATVRTLYTPGFSCALSEGDVIIQRANYVVADLLHVQPLGGDLQPIYGLSGQSGWASVFRPAIPKKGH